VTLRLRRTLADLTKQGNTPRRKWKYPNNLHGLRRIRPEVTQDLGANRVLNDATAGATPRVRRGAEDEVENPAKQVVRFGVFDLDIAARQLRKSGSRIKLQDQPFQILEALVARHGELVTRDELRQQLWRSDTFVDFEHGLNIGISRLREALDDAADNPRFIETIPRRGYRFIAPVQWAQAAVETPAPAPNPPKEPNRPHVPRKYAVALVAVLLAAVLTGLYVYAKRVRTPASSVVPPIQSIAVLPLMNLTGDVGQEFFADAMTEALTTELGKLSSLRVISRTSAMQYKQTRKSVPEIARELSVDAVVEGSVQRSGDRVAITAQLIYAPTDRHLWAQSYERDLRDVLSMQREVADQITYEVQAKMSARESRPIVHKVNPEAYENYVLGRYAWQTRSRESLLRAVSYFQKAIDKDPNFALAYSGEAEAYIPLAMLALMPPREYFEKAREAATKALALDDSLAEAHNALAAVLMSDYRWQDSEREYKKAIELNPNYATAHHWYAFLLEALGRQSANLSQRKLAHQLDPLNLAASGAVGNAYFYLGEYDQAIAEYQRALELNPDFSMTRACLGEAYLAKKMYPEAIAEFTKAGDLGSLGYSYAVSGNRPKAREILAKLSLESKSRYVSPQEHALVLAGLGENEEAIAWLERAERENVSLDHLNVDHEFSSLHSNPRFQQLLRRTGLSR